MICKLKARLNLHGILNVEQGYYVEDMEVEEPIPEEKKDDEKKDPDVSLKLPTPLMPVQASCEDERAAKRPRLG
jgi:heat shock protein 4